MWLEPSNGWTPEIWAIPRRPGATSPRYYWTVPAALKTLTAGDTPTTIAETLKEDGAVIVSGLATADTMDQIATEMEPYIVATDRGHSTFLGHQTRRTGALIARSPTARCIVAHPTVIDTMSQVLGDHASSFQIDLTQLIDIGPGNPAQDIHRDQWSFDRFPFPRGFEVECGTMWAVTEFTEDVGATRVVVGSHRWEKDPPEVDIALSAGAVMAKGSVLLYLGSVYHGGGANTTTDVHRIGVNVGYSLGWLRQEENQFLACPPEIARTLPEGILRLMGYQRGAFALGYVDDMRDPLDWLYDRPTAPYTFSSYLRSARSGIKKTESYVVPGE
jgi:ectoine hydroxylase-related dioxygenase (phytanoyl-CoA dioxygenase family)